MINDNKKLKPVFVKDSKPNDLLLLFWMLGATFGNKMGVLAVSIKYNSIDISIYLKTCFRRLVLISFSLSTKTHTISLILPSKNG